MQEEYTDLISSLQCLSESKIANAARQNKIQPNLLHTAKLCKDRQQGSPGEFDSVVQGSREQQTICSSAKSQAPNLFTVDGDVLIALQVGQAHHLNTTTCHRRRVKQIIMKQHMHRTGCSMSELRSLYWSLWWDEYVSYLLLWLRTATNHSWIQIATRQNP